MPATAPGWSNAPETRASAAPTSPAAAARAKSPETRASQPLRQAGDVLRDTCHLILTALTGRGSAQRRPLRPATGHHSRSGSRRGGRRDRGPKFGRDWRLRLHAADYCPDQFKASPAHEWVRAAKATYALKATVCVFRLPAIAYPFRSPACSLTDGPVLGSTIRCVQYTLLSWDAFQSIGPAKDRTKCTGILPSNGRFNPFLPF